MVCTITVSAFVSPVLLWPLLESGSTITFREYSGTGIPPDYFKLNDLDLKGCWKSYSRSIQGLQEALADNASRLIHWHPSEGFGERLHTQHSMMVQAYSYEIRNNLWTYFGVNRTIEADACYAHFRADEAALLGCFRYGHIFDWSAAFEERKKLCYKPESDTCPIDRSVNPDIIEQTDGYVIERKLSNYSGSGHRNTVVDITDITAVSTEMMVAWLTAGHRVEYDQKILSTPEEDGTVFGTDAYGLDFYAGNIDQPETIISTIQKRTHWETVQEGI